MADDGSEQKCRHQTVINGVRRLSLFHKHSIVIKYSPLSSLIFFEQCIG